MKQNKEVCFRYRNKPNVICLLTMEIPEIVVFRRKKYLFALIWHF